MYGCDSQNEFILTISYDDAKWWLKINNILFNDDEDEFKNEMFRC